jgi:hypothetical protein
MLKTVAKTTSYGLELCQARRNTHGTEQKTANKQ